MLEAVSRKACRGKAEGAGPEGSHTRIEFKSHSGTHWPRAKFSVLIFQKSFSFHGLHVFGAGMFVGFPGALSYA